jgi:hypothetical protein
MSTPGDNAQQRATSINADRLEWQSELDSALSNIDTRLKHPRRRASDTNEQPPLPQLGQVDITSELLDEIAWRVSEQLRRSQAVDQPAAAPATSAAPPTSPASATSPAPRRAARPVTPPPPEPERMPPGISLTIRIRKPLFRFPWRRRVRRESLISFSDYRIT